MKSWVRSSALPKPGVGYTRYPSTHKAEAAGSHVQDQPELLVSGIVWGWKVVCQINHHICLGCPNAWWDKWSPKKALVSLMRVG